ncbi:MAG: HPr(Ser) kinase/phosphatase [Thomasclavelia sp.]|nr:HPr(Ser) kinase/phosphatase [Thomasclavelia sp.]
MEKSITVRELFDDLFETKRITGNDDSENRRVYVSEINRPGFELAGFFKHTEFKRIIILGDKEFAFIEEMSSTAQKEIFSVLINDDLPCIVICKGHTCPKILEETANKKNFPIYVTDSATGRVSIELTNRLDEVLAPETLIHGVFLNIYGKGVIIKGESGIGKSEIALELVKRGHLLVADDAVEIYHIGRSIIGKAPKVLTNLLEIRGVGVIDVSKMFGIASIIDRDKVDLIIQLDRWVPSREYTRVTVEEDDSSEMLLGASIPKVVVPVSSGRNMSVIIETAVMNIRLRESGVDSSKEFVDRIIQNIDDNKKKEGNM